MLFRHLHEAFGTKQSPRRFRLVQGGQSLPRIVNCLQVGHLEGQGDLIRITGATMWASGKISLGCRASVLC